MSRKLVLGHFPPWLPPTLRRVRDPPFTIHHPWATLQTA